MSAELATTPRVQQIDSLFRVRLGPFDSREAAVIARERAQGILATSPSSSAASDDFKIHPSPRARHAVWSPASAQVQLTIDIVRVGASRFRSLSQASPVPTPTPSKCQRVIEADLGRSGRSRPSTPPVCQRSAEPPPCRLPISGGGADATVIGSAADWQRAVQCQLPAARCAQTVAIDRPGWWLPTRICAPPPIASLTSFTSS